MGEYLLITLAALGGLISGAAPECWPRDYGFGSPVCVCNMTHCDFIGDVGPPSRGKVVAFESNKAGLRFARTVLPLNSMNSPGDKNEVEDLTKNQPARDNRGAGNSTVVLSINQDEKYQSIFGFGGAFTDAVGINLRNLPLKMQDDIIKSYYSKEGLEYSIGRIPMASTDFSVRKYTYDDVPGDFKLLNFTLTEEDLQLKIPYIKRAMSMSTQPIWLYGSPWSSPAWMKTSKRLEGRGFLKERTRGLFYKTWARYFVRFVQEYERQGVPMWGLTTQNEPTTGFIPFYPRQTMGFTPQTQRDFIKLDLGPELTKAGYGPDRLKLMIFDDNRIGIRYWANVVLGDHEAAKYVSGVAVHWYKNWLIGPWVLDMVHHNYPGKFILPSEACTGYSSGPHHQVMLGSWSRAEEYATDILQNLNHWSSGWTDWNMALDTQGGPNWARNFADSPIIVNASAKEFYKQPMYYALGHFSKFLPRGSIRIDSRLNRSSKNLSYVAFLTPKSDVVVIVLNGGEERIILEIKDKYGSVNTRKVIGERSITTFIWRL
ncbi:lysosomal acid glucosylceramidase-like [Dermacentor silvarum]|uniref:lysosomal acid glucosylceramidase-like n=1 Tax=Dermacentor silvarum TaxID=543639 RepID=UPI0018989D2A|nr:lysosomal acid glucosylceramidase-like [Dermacentor silvarum]XP_049518023.1 lysosomal acid glucosylceramidase-like [Dermacentor silvarum]